ncbi:MAG: ATP-binding protein [Acetivibrionales bacterium]
MDLSYIKLKKIKIALDSLCIYRVLLDDNVVYVLNELVNCLCGKTKKLDEYLKLYSSFYFNLCSQHPGKSFKEYIVDKLLFTCNPFSYIAETYHTKDIDSTFLMAVKDDLYKLSMISDVSSKDIKNCMIEYCTSFGYETDTVNSLPDWDKERLEPVSKSYGINGIDSMRSYMLNSSDWSQCVNHLIDFHKSWGTGIFARYKAFVWDYCEGMGKLRGVEEPDPVSLSELIGYQTERKDVIDNTQCLLKGLPANNILLYGDRGAGKSSTVKAIVNEFYCQGLRMVEVPKSRLIDFPIIINCLRKSSLKFIIFVDDLAFEDNEENYTALKAALEGGVEIRPGNVVIYATSNRRHIIKERFSDRTGLYSANRDDEVRAADSIQEKLSLADRFGITVVFSSPDKQKYLHIVEGIAKKRSLLISKEQLHEQALKWALWYNGYSPRTARQFIDWLEGDLSKSRNNNDA